MGPPTFDSTQSARPTAAHQQGHQQHGCGRTRNPGRSRDDLCQTVDRLHADLLHIVSQRQHLEAVHVLDVIGSQVQVLPAVANTPWQSRIDRSRARGSGSPWWAPEEKHIGDVA